MKDNCSRFAPTPYFRARAIRWCHLNFSPADPRSYGNNFLDKMDKIDYNSAPAKDNCTLFSPTPYFRARAMQWCHENFSPEDPCCHGSQPLLFKDKIGCRLTIASNAETQLLGYIAWQWDRYLVPQNVFLVWFSFQCQFAKKFRPHSNKANFGHYSTVYHFPIQPIKASAVCQNTRKSVNQNTFIQNHVLQKNLWHILEIHKLFATYRVRQKK